MERHAHHHYPNPETSVSRVALPAGSGVRFAFSSGAPLPPPFQLLLTYAHLLVSQVISKNAPVSLEVLPGFEADVAAYNTDIA